jgi:IclR family pca regulon transcriptional regulator
MEQKNTTSTAPAIDRRDLIDGLGKGLRVIEAFDDEWSRQTASQVAERTGISRTAARRYLLSLVHFGYAATDGKQFWLTPRVLRLGQSYLDAARMPRLVKPFIQRISMQCGQTVNVSVLDGHEVIYVARSNPPRLVSIGYQSGARVPAHAVSPGVVMVASMDNAAVDQWIAEHEFAAFTGHTVHDGQRFRELVLQARQQGYWITDQQLDIGFQGVAVPLLDRRGQCQGAVSMTLPSNAYTPAQVVAELLPLLRDTAQDLRSML